jgi:hypothetical protein
MTQRRIWRIPVLVNSKGDIIKIWKPRPWIIDPENNFDEAELAMSFFNDRKIKIGILTSGLPPLKNIRLVIRKEDGKTKKDVFKMYDLLLESPTILAKGREDEFDIFLRKVKEKSHK